MELETYRQRRARAASALIAMIDADSKTLQDRLDELDGECGLQSVSFRQGGEAVAIAIPKRNIETWIHYLLEGQADEKKLYPKLPRERQCKPAVDALVRLCKSEGLPQNAPTSLLAACDEYRTRIEPVRAI